MFDNIKKRIADNTADIIIKSKAANDNAYFDKLFNEYKNSKSKK